MFLSWEVDKKNCVKFIWKFIYIKFCIKIVGLNSSYSGNIQPIWKQRYLQRNLKNLGLLFLLFEFNNFSFLIDIIDNIINTFVSCDRNCQQWQCSITITCLRLYHVISILHCHWWEWEWKWEILNFIRIFTFNYCTFSKLQINALQFKVKM